MIAVKGIYHQGQLKLDRPVKSDKPLEVIITFLEEGVELEQKKNLKKENFSFTASRKLLSNYKGSLSDVVIEERKEGV